MKKTKRTLSLISSFVYLSFAITHGTGSQQPHHEEGHNLTTSRKGKANIVTTCSFCNILINGGGSSIGNGSIIQIPPASSNSTTQKPDIFLGQPAYPEWFPHTVFLNFLDQEVRPGVWSSFICTGSIYTPWTIITAAHCVFRGYTTQLFAPDKAFVYAGSRVGTQGVKRQAAKIIPHPDYKGWERAFINDVALIILAQPYDLNNKTISSIEIADDVKLPPSTTCTLSAYGSKSGSDGVNDAGSLQYAPMVISPDNACSDAYSSTSFDPNTCVCAGGNGLPRQCSGDSGGPLAVEGADEKLKIYGIVSNSVKSKPASASVPCSDPRPGVYTRAPKFRKWIDENTKR